MQVENSDTFDPSRLLKVLEQFQPAETLQSSTPARIEVIDSKPADAVNVSAELSASGQKPCPPEGSSLYSARGVVSRAQARKPAPLGQHINVWA